MSRTPKRAGPGRALLRAHRRIGVVLSAIFLLICATGILLNHQDDIDFQSRPVKADWIYDWYGVEPKSEILHYQLDSHAVSWIDGTIYFDTRSRGSFPTPVGVAELEQLIAVASSDSLLLLTKEGDILEHIRRDSLPAGSITGVQVASNGILIIDTESGTFASDESILNWVPTSWDSNRGTLAPTPPPSSIQDELLKAFRGESITWGRVLLDLHTGRFFGSIGKWIVDFTAIGLAFLTLSGVFYTLRYLKKARERASK